MKRLAGLVLILALFFASEAKAQDEYVEGLTGMQFVLVKGGCFEMGDTFGDGQADELPVHDVCLGDYYISKHEVTIEQFLKFVIETGYKTEPEIRGYSWTRVGPGKEEKVVGLNWRDPGFIQQLSHPVVCISWNDANAFAAWLSKQTGRTFRLPTEAEWEFAARSMGRQVKYATYTGDVSRDLANYQGTGGKDAWPQTSPVGAFPPNDLGLYDMSGNAYEWILDTHSKQAYTVHAERNPYVKGNTDRHGKRGGSWGVPPEYLRAANRGSSTHSGNDLGFRLVMVP